MRRALALLMNRYGIAGLLVVIVLFVVVIARLSGHDLAPKPAANPPAEVTTTAPSAASPTGSPAPNDGLPPTASRTVPNRAALLATANDCAKAWINHKDVTADQWWQAVTRYTTDSLTKKLKGVDPAGVPADRIIGSSEIGSHGSTWAEVDIPVDSGILRLRMITTAPGWQVDGIDWRRQ